MGPLEDDVRPAPDRERAGRLEPIALDVVHADVYRLDRVQDVVDLGLDELRDTGRAILLVEWGDAVVELMPDHHVRVELSEPDPAADVRRIVLSATGPSWAERWERLEHALAAWAVAA